MGTLGICNLLWSATKGTSPRSHQLKNCFVLISFHMIMWWYRPLSWVPASYMSPLQRGCGYRLKFSYIPFIHTNIFCDIFFSNTNFSLFVEVCDFVILTGFLKRYTWSTRSKFATTPLRSSSSPHPTHPLVRSPRFWIFNRITHFGCDCVKIYHTVDLNVTCSRLPLTLIRFFK